VNYDTIYKLDDGSTLTIVRSPGNKSVAHRFISAL
jgi:hypothetical protein